MEATVAVKIIGSRPLVADILFELRFQHIPRAASASICYAANGHFFARTAAKIKRNLICSAAELGVDHGGAVRRHGLGFGLLEGEVLAVGDAVGQALAAGDLRARRRGLLLGAEVDLKFIVVRVFAPVGNQILHLRRVPHGAEGGAAIGREGAGDDIFAMLPAAEGIAHLGGRGDGIQIDAAALPHILGGNAGAAVGIEGDEEGGRGDGGHAGVLAHHGFRGEGGARFLDHPAVQNRVLRLILVRFREGYLVAARRRGLFGGEDAALGREEVDVIHVRKLGVIGNRFRIVLVHGDRLAEGGSVASAVAPAGELLVLAAGVRRAGIVEGFAVLENLAGELMLAVLEDIGMRGNRRLHDAFQRKAITGLRAAGDGHDGRQRVHGRAADEHDQRHQQGKTPTKLVFHKKLILPMKFR